MGGAENLSQHVWVLLTCSLGLTCIRTLEKTVKNVVNTLCKGTLSNKNMYIDLKFPVLCFDCKIENFDRI